MALYIIINQSKTTIYSTEDYRSTKNEALRPVLSIFVNVLLSALRDVLTV